MLPVRTGLRDAHSGTASFMGEAKGGDTDSVWSGVSGGSTLSRASFSDGEVWKMKRLMNDQERKEMENNIAIRGIRVDTNDMKAALEEFL